ncbi:polymer-forming cytoskeletal protein [Paraburkholderia sp. EG287A]|uniref:polymer-forming cytoskeletal protein n=1 Tax=Paraburkholderia sp. EG287A TaxID=3237012 RepID=UPI0034D333D5
MNRKYRLLPSDSIIVGSRTLYRVQALRDVSEGVVHGTLGGYIECEANLSHAGRAWVADSATIYQNAVVSGNALVQGHAVVRGSSSVADDARVYGYAQVATNARISERAAVFDNAIVSGKACIAGDAIVYGRSSVHDGHVFGRAHVRGNAVVLGSARIKDFNDISTFDGIGPRASVVTAYRTGDGSVEVVCTGFRGSLAQFRLRVQADHGARRKDKAGWALLGLANLIEFQFSG